MQVNEMTLRWRYHRFVLAYLGACLLGSAPGLRAQPGSDRWPAFRDPNSSGHAGTTNLLPVEFGPGRNEAWRVATPKGHSSPCVWDQLIFLTGVETDSKKLETLAVRRSDGQIQWRSFIEAATLEDVHRVSNQATATCATDGQRVVSYFGSFGLVCYDLTGKEVWRLPMPVFHSMNGSGTSPVIVEGTVYLNREDSVEQVLIAVDVASGTQKWKRKHPNASSNRLGVTSTPVYWNRQLLVHRSGSVSAYDAASGEVAWFIPANITGCSTPAISDGKLVVAAWQNFGEPAQAPPWPEFATLLQKHDADKNGKLSKAEVPGDLLIAKRPELDPGLGGNMPLNMFFDNLDTNHDGQIDAGEWQAGLVEWKEYLKNSQHGVMAVDLTRPGQPSEKSILWKMERNVPEVPSPLIHRGQVYLVQNGGIVICLNLASGQVIYQERLGPLGPYYASPVEAAGNIYIAAGNGRVAVLREGTQFQLLGLNDLKEGVFASPAPVGDQLLIRTEKHLFAFRR
jgi:outer membrane protein assembly factor BamB